MEQLSTLCTVAALIIEPVGFLCGENTQELLGLFFFFPQRMLTKWFNIQHGYGMHSLRCALSSHVDIEHEHAFYRQSPIGCKLPCS
jgi:hypothetical protein